MEKLALNSLTIKKLHDCNSFLKFKKTDMNNFLRQISIFVFVMVLLPMTAVQAQLTLSSTSNVNVAACGDNVVISIKAVSGFNNLGTLQYSVNWDQSKLQYISNAPVTIDGDAPAIGLGAGTLTYTWFDGDFAPYGATLGAGTEVLTITLKVISSPATLNVNITGTPAVIEAGNNLFVEVPVTLNNNVSIAVNSGPVKNENQTLFYCNIQDAIDDADDNDVITVSAGVYNITSSINVHKPVTINGPQMGVDPRTAAGFRTPGDASEAIVDGGGSLLTIFSITAPGVILNGLEVRNGKGDLISTPTGSPMRNGVIVKYCIVRNSATPGDEGIQLRNVSGGGVEYCRVFSTTGDGINLCCGSTNTFARHNEIYSSSSADGVIYLYDNGPDMLVDYNYLYNNSAADGIKVGDKDGGDDNKNHLFLNNAIVSNNTIDGNTGTSGIGIYINTSRVNILNNTVRNCGSTANGAIYLRYPIKNIVITNNEIYNNYRGIRVGSSVSLASTVSINENSLYNNSFQNIQNQSGETVNATCNWLGSTVLATNASKINGPVTYIPWLSTNVDVQPLVQGFQPEATCGNGVMVDDVTPFHILCGSTTGSIEVEFSGGVVPYSIAWSGPSSGSESPVSSGYVIPSLSAGSYNITVTSANGTTATATATVQYLPITLSGVTPTTYFATIQAAIAASQNGDIVDICDGTHSLSSHSSINNDITLQGHGRDNTIVEMSSSWFNVNPSIALTLNAPGITVKDIHFKVVGAGAEGSILGVFQSNTQILNNKFSGTYVYGATQVTRATVWSASPVTGILMDNNIIESLRQPGYLSAGSGDISNNTISNTRGWVIESAQALNFTGNIFGANTSHITILMGANVSGLEIHDNDLSGAVEDWAIDNRIPNLSVDATCNWYGAPTTPAAKITGVVNYCPWLTNGSDNSANAGFQPVPNSCNGTDGPGGVVTNTNTGNLYCSIQAAINAASPNDEITASAGTYNENVIINKALTLNGANVGIACPSGTRVTESIISGSGGMAVKIDAPDVTIDGFTITNPTGSFGVYNKGNSNATIQNNIVTDIGNATSGSGATYGISIEMGSSANMSNVDINNNCVDNIRGGANTSLTGAAAKSNNGSGVGIGAGFSNAAFDIDNLSITCNTVSSITASISAFADGGKGAYGVIINVGASASFPGKANNPSVTNNTITSLEGLWSHGVGLEGETPGAIVASNIMDNFVDHKGNTDAVGVRVEDNVGVASVMINDNSFTNMVFGVSNVMGTSVNAESNWYGSAAAATVAAKNDGVVDYIPWVTDEDDQDSSCGFQPIPATGTPVEVSSARPTHILCGPTTGSIEVTFSGGTGPYNISWAGPSSGGPVAATSVHTITPLAAGAYTITVTDANLSTATISATVLYLPVTNTTDGLHFATIQAAIDAPTTSDGEVINVCAGTYVENVVVNKRLQILGAQNPFFAPASFINTSTIGGNAITITVDGIAPGGTGNSLEIQNIYCQGKTTDILNNNDYGINVTVPVYYLNLYNVYADNYRFAGLIFNGTNTTSPAKINIWDCRFQNNDLGINLGLGMVGDGPNGIYIKNGLIKNNRYSGLITAGNDAQILSNITVEGVQFEDNGSGGTALSTYASDIFMQRFNGNGSFKNLTFNTYAATAMDLRGKGALGSPTGAAGTVLIDNCSFTGNPDNLTASNKTMIKVRNYTNIDNLSFLNTVVNTRSAADATGLRFESITADPSQTLSGLSFPATGAFGTGHDIVNATAMSIDATSGVTFGAVGGCAIEDRVYHALDFVGLGLVTWTANNDYVTTNTLGIQRGIDAASNGFNVNVCPGTFNQNVNVTKPVTIKGAQFGQPCATRLGAESIVAGGVGTAFTISSTGVTIDGFDITGRTGIASTGFTDFTVRNNKIAADWIGINITGLNTATAAGTIDLNCVDMTTQFNGDVSQPTVGILLNGVNGAIPLTVTDNIIQDGHYGYVLHNINPASVKQEISGGTIKGVMQGVAVVNTLTGAAPYASSKVEVDNVIMSMFAGSSVIPDINFHAGIYSFTGGGTTTETIALDVNNGSINGTGKPSQSSGGIYIADFSTGAVKQTVAVNNALIQNNRNRGIDARGKVSVSVTNSIIDGNGYDAFAAGGNDGFAMIAQQGATINATNNFITHPVASATTVTAFLTANGTGSTINATNNSVLMNGNPMGKGATNDAGHTINATCNWWGLPCATNIAPLMSGVVTYDPFLALGTDVGGVPTDGFQPAPGACISALTAAIAGVTTLCEPGLTSVLTGSATGGLAPYTTHLWSSATPANVIVSPTNAALTTATSMGQGSSIITYTVTDTNGCTDTETVTFTVTNPTVFPTYTIPAMGASVAGYTCGATINRFTDPASCNSFQTIVEPVWADNCVITATTATANNSVTLTDLGAFVSGTFPKGSTIVTFTATDASGNTTTCSITIVVSDNIPPVFSSLPTSFTVAAPPGDCSLIVNWVPPVANDNCPGTVTVTSNFNPGAVFVVPSVNTITYTATDAAGITATYSFMITVTGNCIPAVDLSVQSPAFALDPVGDFTLPVVKDGVITVKNNGVNASHELAPLGNIKVLVGVPSSTVFTTVGALTPENDDWIVTEYPSSPPGVKMYLFTLKPTLSIAPAASKSIRVRITPVGYIGQKGVITAQLYNGSGGDISPNNNYTQGSFQIAN